MQVSLRVPLEYLDKLERQETNAKFAKRLRIVILAIRGYTAPVVAMSLGLSRRVVQRWVRRYNDEGIPGLKDRPSAVRQADYEYLWVLGMVCPELNPIENPWHFLKSHYWSNHAHDDDYEALEAAAIKAWRHAVLDPELMKTVCAVPYLERTNSG